MTRLIAIDQVLTWFDNSQKVLEPYILTTVFANAAARAAVKTIESSSTKFQEFYNSWVGQMGSLGWNITEAGSSSISYRTTTPQKQKTTLAKSIISRLSSELPRIDNKSVFTTITDNKSADIWDFWWNHVTENTEWIYFVFGSLSDGDDVPKIQLDFLYADASKIKYPKQGLGNFFDQGQSINTESWACLFEEVVEDSISLTSKPLQADLNIQIYEKKLPQIKSMLGDKVSDHYKLFPHQ